MEVGLGEPCQSISEVPGVPSIISTRVRSPEPVLKARRGGRPVIFETGGSQEFAGQPV